MCGLVAVPRPRGGRELTISGLLDLYIHTVPNSLPVDQYRSALHLTKGHHDAYLFINNQKTQETYSQWLDSIPNRIFNPTGNTLNSNQIKGFINVFL
ncbi:hypothetical protein D9M69_598890 [compost metagenome]